VSGGYVLVGVWIASPRQVLEEFPGYRRGTVGQEGRWPCVYVEFPAEQPFYPLLATSTYGHEQMQIDLYVIGWVAPDGARGGDWFQAAGGRWRHYWQEQLPEGTAAPFAQGLALKGIPYTHVSIQGEAAAFADDLRFRTVDVPGMAYADAVVFLRRSRLGLAAALLVVAALSYASGGLTGLLLYGKWKGCASLGLWNLLTFIGLDLAYRRASRREPEKFMGKTGRPAQFLPVFTGVFVLLSVPLGMLLRLPLR
jgi:hypothetical protein